MLEALFDSEKRMEEINDEVVDIFEKLRVWRTAGGKRLDSQQIEDFVGEKLRADPPVKIHNAKTAFKLLQSFAQEA
jgi:hypothetical protein